MAREAGPKRADEAVESSEVEDQSSSPRHLWHCENGRDKAVLASTGDHCPLAHQLVYELDTLGGDRNERKPRAERRTGRKPKSEAGRYSAAHPLGCVAPTRRKQAEPAAYPLAQLTSEGKVSVVKLA